jgi:hypothetical protein
MYHCQAFFTVLNSSKVIPPIEKGKRDSCWIKHKNSNEEELKKCVRDKMLACYGVRIKGIVFNPGYWSSY